MPSRFFRLVLSAPMAALFALPLAAQNIVQQDQNDPKAILAAERYQRPPAVIEKIVTASRNGGSIGNPSPDHKTFLKVETDAVYSLEDFAKGHLRLGGLEIDTAGFRARALTTRGGHGITLVDAMTGKTRVAETPAGGGLGGAAWAPRGKTHSYGGGFPQSTHSYLVVVATAKS